MRLGKINAWSEFVTKTQRTPIPDCPHKVDVTAERRRGRGLVGFTELSHRHMYFDHPFTGLAILGALIGFLTTALVTPSGRRALRWILVSMAAMLVALCEMLVQNRDSDVIQRG